MKFKASYKHGLEDYIRELQETLQRIEFLTYEFHCERYTKEEFIQEINKMIQEVQDKM